MLFQKKRKENDGGIHRPVIMKISEAILLAIQKSGGRIESTQFAEWIGYLIKNGYINLTLNDKDADLKVYLELTKKGKIYLSKARREPYSRQKNKDC